MIKYSVLVPFHSNLNLLTMCISALQEALDPCESEIIIIDNNANGSQIDPTWNLGKQCKIITRRENLMYPGAINLGAEYAQGDYLLFCDADTCVTKNFHRALTRELAADGVGYASAKLLNMGTGDLLEFGITSSYYNFPHPFSGRPKSFPLIAQNHYPLAACAACAAIKRELFTSIGGFDRELVHSYSDIDLCLRLLSRQYRTVCVSDAVAYHCGASTVGSGMGAGLKEDTKGIFMAKHPDIPTQIGQYIEAAYDFFLRQNELSVRDYFILDCSTIANAELYLNAVTEHLDLKEVGRYRQPVSPRDAAKIDCLNTIPYQIRNYRLPILYFVDHFLALRGNDLWKICRAGLKDLVVDRHANIELLCNI